MFKWEIDKEFHFEMGHRVWAQELNHPHLSISTECACKHLHGHSYVVKVAIGSDVLDGSSMVTDFKNLNFAKEFVDNVLDHRFLIDINDPNFKLITSAEAPTSLQTQFVKLVDVIGASTDPAVKLHHDSFVLCDFVPTSENICRYLKEFFQPTLGDVATITAVDLWETKKSHCRYTG